MFKIESDVGDNNTKNLVTKVKKTHSYDDFLLKCLFIRGFHNVEGFLCICRSNKMHGKKNIKVMYVTKNQQSSTKFWDCDIALLFVLRS